VLSIVSLGVLLWSVIEAPSKGWTAPEIVAGFVVGAILLAAFLLWELHSRHPMLDMHFFQNPRFSAASGAIALVFLSLFGTLFLLTQYLQSVLGYSTIEAGAVLLPQAATIMIFAPLSSVWVQKFGNKLVVATGLTIVTASLLLFETFDPGSSVLHVIAVTVVMGAGMANVLAPCTDSIMGSLPREKAGVGSAVNDTTRQMGGAIGVAVFGSIMASHYTSSITAKLGADVPARVLSAIGNNVGQAVGIAKQTPPPLGAKIAAAAKDSFVSGLHIIGFAAAGITFIAVVGVLLFLPARAPDEGPGPDEPGETAPVPAAVTQPAG
jgi:Na+/melibiose symporter-like transporter